MPDTGVFIKARSMTTANSALMAEEIGHFMTHLFALKVQATEIDSASLCPLAAVATYVDGSDFVQGYLLCDLPCAAILGAALTHIPMQIVDDTVDNGELTKNLKDNASEVFNIAVNLFPNHRSSRLVLKGIRFDEKARLPPEDESRTGDDFRINVDRYGSGLLRIIHHV